MKILLLEDNKDMADAIKFSLKKYVEVEWVENGYKGLDWLSEIQDFNLIISDYQMPEMDGLEFITELRKVTSAIPVVLFTGNPTVFKNKEDIKKQYDIQKVINKDICQLVEFTKKFKISLTM